MFEKLNVFEDKDINQLCDDLYQKAGIGNLLICGGVARCLLGEVHTPKDLDLVTINQLIFDKIKSQIHSLNG